MDIFYNFFNFSLDFFPKYSIITGKESRADQSECLALCLYVKEVVFMLSFILCLALLIVGYITYGKIVDNTFCPDDRQTHAVRINDGVDYVALSGDPVLAVNIGNVFFDGYLESSVYTVILDHGLGLKSWYYNMSSLDVNVGDAVAKGDRIGYVGTTGFTPTAGLHVKLTVFDVPVCPYDLWENGIIMSE